MEQTRTKRTAKILTAALSLVLTLVMILAIFPAITLPASADGTTVNLSTLSAPYTAHDGETLTGALGGDHEIFIEAGATVTLNGVVIDREVDHYNDGAAITCLGDATIILKGTNEVAGYNYGSYGAAGITVAEGYTLTIQGDGKLEARGVSRYYGAGIGSNQKNACGNIIINSGTITATGSDYAAGIGSGRNGKCGDITINGGTITATGGDSGAAIGAGESAQCGTITINGGTITATGGDYAAGIGCGYYETAACTAIVINGGTITATGGNSGAAIGSGYDGNCGPITISGGAITATGGEWATVIGSGECGTCGDITIISEEELGLPVTDHVEGRNGTVYLALREAVFSLSDNASGSVTLTQAQKSDILCVPKKAVTEINGQSVVYYPDEYGIRSYKEVEVGLTDGNFVEIISGLEEGDPVIIK